MKKTLAKLLCATTLAFSPIISQNLIAQNSADTTKKESTIDYIRLGMTFRDFNDNDLKKEVGALFGFELNCGKNMTKNFDAELYNSWFFKGWDNGKKRINIFETGVFGELTFGDFYIGLAPKMVSYFSRNEGKKFSDVTFGFGGRMGYEIKLSDKMKLDLDINYSKVNIEEDGEKYDIGTNGFSVRLKF
jgi:hypothetical protein